MSQPHNPNAICSDRYTAKPVILPLLAALVTGVIYSFTPMLGLLCFAALCMAWVVWTLANIYRAVTAVRLGLCRRACSLTAITVCTGPAMAASMVIPGDYIHLAMLYPYYSAETARGQPGPRFFSWGGVGDSERSLAYDDLGTLKTQVGTTRSDEGVWRTTRHLVGNFYVVEISW